MQDFFLLPPASYRQGVYRTCGADPIMKISPQSTRRAQSIFVFLCELCVLCGYLQRRLIWELS